MNIFPSPRSCTLTYICTNVLVAASVDEREAKQDTNCGVGEHAIKRKMIMICVQHSEGNALIINDYIRRIIVQTICWNMFFLTGELKIRNTGAEVTKMW